MGQLNLHPCTAQMTWLSDRPRTAGGWEYTLCDFLADLGRNCITGAGSLIGHIKGIATVAGSPVLRLSLVSASQPVSVEGTIPDNISELGVTLNVLVFGTPADKLSAAITAARDQALSSWPGSIDVEILPAAAAYPLAHHGGDR